jgi:hypothetical protein
MKLGPKARTWIKGLLAALIGGSATSVSAKIVLPNTIIDWEDIWKLAVCSGIINVCFYLKNSPVPEDETNVWKKEEEK